MPSMFRAAVGATLLASLAACGGGDPPLLPEVTPPPSGSLPPGTVLPPIGTARTDCAVVSVSDGDTFRCRLPGATRDTTVRLLLVDAPETAQTPWGDSSRVALQRWIVVGRTVQLERETEDADAFGRLLRYPFVGDTNVVVQLAGSGHVVAFPFPRRAAPNSVRYLAAIDSAVAIAQAQRRGLWGTAYAFSPLPCTFRGASCP